MKILLNRNLFTSKILPVFLNFTLLFIFFFGYYEISPSQNLNISSLDTVFIPGKQYFGKNNYIEYIAGNMPVIISAPHGGRDTPNEIPNRTYGETTTDANTQELARDISNSFFARTGKYPHVIICRLSRKKLDPNREIIEAAQGNALAAEAWREFHSFIDTASKIITGNNEKGLLIDIHGHGHEIQRLEIGYLISPKELSYPDSELDKSIYPARSSIKNLYSLAGTSFSELLRGETSLGTFFEYRGYPAVPSMMQKDPGDNLYFEGGYNTVRHGSLYGGNINAIQIECNMSFVRDTDPNRKKFANAFTEIIEYYMNMHFYRKPVARYKPVINEILFDVPKDNQSTTIFESDANGDSIQDFRSDQFVEIINSEYASIDISGYQLLDKSLTPLFTFPSNTILRPYEMAVVFGGIGPKGFGKKFPSNLKIFNARNGPDSGFYSSSSKPYLRNIGDNVILFNPPANNITDEIYWGDAVKKSPTGVKLVAPNTILKDSISGGIGQSVVRNPDITGLWILQKKLGVDSQLYSPGRSNLTAIKENIDITPKTISLMQNFPNPFNPETNIKYTIMENCLVTIKIYDLFGREIETLINRQRTPGIYDIRWHPYNIASGIYYYTLETTGFNTNKVKSTLLTKKMIYIK